MRDKKGSLLIFLGLLLIVAALSLAAFNLWDGSRAAASAERVLLKLPPEIHGTPSGERPAAAEAVIPDYILDPCREMPTAEVEGRAYIGVLEIPALALELPVIGEWSYPALKVAPCRYAGSAYLDDLVIAAHNYTRHFGRLKELSEGDAVTFTDMDGNVFHYQVAVLETMVPTAVEEMTSGDYALTLFTCTVGGQSRIAIRCDRMEED